jgi:ATP-dependent Clp protease ATP-binding subunit ClpX
MFAYPWMLACGKEAAVMRPDHFLNQYAPEKILEKLEEIVIGQEQAKRALVAAVWWNMYRSALVAAGQDAKLLPAKMNVLLVGPSGIGKTELAKAIAGLFGVPWVTTAAPNYSSAGYTGADVDDMLGLLLQAAGGDQEAAERGIVVLDEVDKLRRRDFGGQSDVGCEAIQQAMLSLLEGCDAMPRGRAGERTKMRSHFVTFVGTGAFVGLNVEPGPVQAASLVTEGFIPEFIARWSMRIRMEDVDREMLRKIIHGRNSALARMSHLFDLHGISLVIDEKAIDSLVNQALKDGVGARALNETLWMRLSGLISEIPQMLQGGVGQVVIDPKAIEGLPAWKIPGDGVLPDFARALLHPIKANEVVDTAGWSEAELHQRLDFLFKEIALDRAGVEAQGAFRTYLETMGGRKKILASVRLCEEMAFVLTPPCSAEEFCSAMLESGCESSEGVLMYVQYKRIVNKEQKPTRVRVARKRATCQKCSANLPPKTLRCPTCGAMTV